MTIPHLKIFRHEISLFSFCVYSGNFIYLRPFVFNVLFYVFDFLFLVVFSNKYFLDFFTSNVQFHFYFVARKHFHREIRKENKSYAHKQRYSLDIFSCSLIGRRCYKTMSSADTCLHRKARKYYENLPSCINLKVNK